MHIGGDLKQTNKLIPCRWPRNKSGLLGFTEQFLKG